ncbi:hypothetical protein BDZ94DRAFT_1226006 [Collybia nuda]|uniref:Zinc-ribbon 15 domain-containing protein n=1 Tax=Collybia nuda TaxID=64659 RepID=A0A9P5XXQ8_9AGAR|nr:hypothetical protein BDZ94DRAFT_1226006 [Collybia nuda]
MFFCLPIFFGCATKLKPEGEQQTARVCPRCHNASVIYAKSTTWFELFWVPLVPFSKKHIWICTICQYTAAADAGQANNTTSARGPIPVQGYQLQQHQPGYAPAYINQGSGK